MTILILSSYIILTVILAFVFTFTGYRDGYTFAQNLFNAAILVLVAFVVITISVQFFLLSFSI